VAEQNNELLMKNHETHPSGSNPTPEVNATRYDNQNSRSGRGRGRGHGRGRGCGHDHGRGNYGVQFKNTRNFHKSQEMGDKDKDEIEKTKNACYRCGGRSQWANNPLFPLLIRNLSNLTFVNNYQLTN